MIRRRKQPETPVTTHRSPIIWKPLYDALQEQGLLPDNCCRITIDARVGEPAVITYETYADDRILGIAPAICPTDDKAESLTN